MQTELKNFIKDYLITSDNVSFDTAQNLIYSIFNIIGIEHGIESVDLTEMSIEILNIDSTDPASPKREQMLDDLVSRIISTSDIEITGEKLEEVRQKIIAKREKLGMNLG